MDLGFDHPDRTAQFLGRFHRLLHREGRNASGHRHAKLTQDLFALVLVNLHEVSLYTQVIRGVRSKPIRQADKNLDFTAVKCIMLQCTNLIPC